MATVVNHGLPEFMTWLQQLPTSLTQQAAPIVEAAARETVAAAEAAYPVRTGELKKSLEVREEQGGALVVKYVAVNTAKHALWFENGTQVRHTKQGWNRGAMPPGHVLIPAAQRARPEMQRQLVAMVEAEGFAVTGSGL